MYPVRAARGRRAPSVYSPKESRHAHSSARSQTSVRTPARRNGKGPATRSLPASTSSSAPRSSSSRSRRPTWLKVDHAVGVASGTDALLVALMALDVGPGDEVILPTFSFFATAGVVARLGATPVFVDIDPVDFNMDPAAVRDRITDRTKAIIPVHLFGQSADLAAIAEVAGDVPILEDCAQAWGADFGGRYVGGHGVMGAFSFFPSKNLGGFGDGGLVTTNDAELAAKLRELRVHGQSGPYLHPVVGGNFRLDAIQAAVLRVKLPHVQGWIQGRRANAMRYVDLFTQKGLDKVLGSSRSPCRAAATPSTSS